MSDISKSKLLETPTGILQSNDAFIVIIRTEWNAEIVDELEKGCAQTLAENNIRDIRIISVPGAFEISFAIKNYWDVHKYRNDRPDAFIALGCVLRGETPHFDYICKAVTEGILYLNLNLPVPTVFGILTVDNQQQAEDRLGGRNGHKGKEAAITAIKMVTLLNDFKIS
jgi:6,7-dimethyl-8-ribityllumazine synthase